MLHRLPNELFWEITKHLAHGDLKHLCEVSEHLYEMTIPQLYESVTLFITESSLEEMERLKRSLRSIPSDHLKHTKYLYLKAPYHRYIENKCHHLGLPQPEDIVRFRSRLRKERSADRASQPWDWLSDLTSPLGSILLRLTNHKLRTLKWELESCIPDDMVDHYRDLIENQRNIDHISLVTDDICGASFTMPAVLLRESKAIRSLRWKGLRSTASFVSVCGCIKANAHGIETLELDLRNWIDAKEVFSKFPGEAKLILPHLSSLSLSEVSFQAAAEEMRSVLNITRLSSLKLRNCRYSLDLLDTIVRGAQTLRLRSFELVIDIGADKFQGDREENDVCISTFVDSFRGLEDLYLLITDPIDWGLISRSISQHVSTLNRLITHRRQYGMGRESPILWCNDLKNLYQAANLTCIGTDSKPSNLVRDWEGLSPKPSCKILHLRSDFSYCHGYNRSDDHISIDYTFLNKENEEMDWDRESSAGGIKSNHKDDQSTSVESLPITSTSRADSAPQSLPPPATFYGAKRVKKIAAGNSKSKDCAEVIDCARWAFSDKGLPNLEIFAFGDFSGEGQYASQNLLLCRDGNTSERGRPALRAITYEDYHLWDLIHENMDMLAACRVSKVADRYYSVS